MQFWFICVSDTVYGGDDAGEAEELSSLRRTQTHISVFTPKIFSRPYFRSQKMLRMNKLNGVFVLYRTSRRRVDRTDITHCIQSSNHSYGSSQSSVVDLLKRTGSRTLYDALSF